MVYQIKTEKKRIFLDALVITIIIFFIGLSIGFLIEYLRTNSLVQNYNNYETESLDARLQNYYYQVMDKSSCNEAIKQNFLFADQIYSEGLKIQQYEEANEITNDLLQQKKRYVLLDVELWLNSVLLKNKCNATYDTLIYIYASNADTAKVAEQKVMSNILESVKQDRNNTVILIPIAGDLGLDSVNLQERIYKVTSFPSLVINEKYVLTGYHSKDEIEAILDKS